MTTVVPRYIKNWNIHKDLEVLSVKTVISKHTVMYLKNLERHQNPLVRNILNDRGHIRLIRSDIPSLVQISQR